MISERQSARLSHNRSGTKPVYLPAGVHPPPRTEGTAPKSRARSFDMLPALFRGWHSRSVLRRRKKTDSPAAASRSARSPDGRPARLPVHFPRPAGCRCVPHPSSAEYPACLHMLQSLPDSSAHSEDTLFVGGAGCPCPFCVPTSALGSLEPYLTYTIRTQ